MRMPLNHILQTVDDATNICQMKTEIRKKIKSTMRRNTREADHGVLWSPNEVSESDEEELQLTPKQLLQLHSITTGVSK